MIIDSVSVIRRRVCSTHVGNDVVWERMEVGVASLPAAYSKVNSSQTCSFFLLTGLGSLKLGDLMSGTLFAAAY